jgi:hypothetical protein
MVFDRNRKGSYIFVGVEPHIDQLDPQRQNSIVLHALNGPELVEAEDLGLTRSVSNRSAGEGG